MSGAGSEIGRPDSPHRRIMASAGSGKTWRLTLRYLELLSSGADVNSLVAATFTRAAAGEMRDRVLQRLCDAAMDPAAAAELARALEHHPTLPPAEGSGRTWPPHAASALAVARSPAALVRRVADDIHRLQIQTLDGFFASIVQAFAVELGLPPSPRIADETEIARLRRAAIASLLEPVDAPRAAAGSEAGAADAREAAEVASLLRRLTNDRPRMSVDRLLGERIEQAYDLWRESDPAGWTLPVPADVDDAAVASALAALRGASASAAEKSPSAKPALSLADAFEAAVSAGGTSGLQALLKTGLPKKVAEGDETFRQKPIPPELVDATRTLMTRIAHVCMAALAEESRAIGELAARFHIAQQRIKRAAGVVTFDDLVGSIIRALDDGDDVTGNAERLAWRLDARLDHMLLDEFQDTSLQQWHGLQPVVERLVEDASAARSLFVVGDVKQSIYGWRGGKPQILAGLPSLILPGAESAIIDEPLARSWRSRPAIIEFVNRVCGTLPDNPAIASPASARAAEDWHADWIEHASAPPLANTSGYAELFVGRPANKESGESAKDALVDSTINRVAHWHRRHPSRTIGILVRSGGLGARLRAGLRAIGIDPALPGGRPVVDDPAVTAVLSLLHLADHPGDTGAFAHVWTSPVAAALELEPVDLRDRRATQRAAARLSRRVRGWIAESGLAAQVGDVVDRLVPVCDASQVRRLRRVAERAAEWSGEGGGVATLGRRPSEFVDRMRRFTLDDPSDAPVQIMTVHASKGLEFDFVVVPVAETERLYRSHHRGPRGFRDAPVGPVTLAHVHVPKAIAAAGFGPADVERLETADAEVARESLSILYVAMTRARAGLSVVVPAPKVAKDARTGFDDTVSGVLCGGVIGADVPEPAGVAWKTGDEARMHASLDAETQGTPDADGSPASPDVGDGSPSERAELAERAELVERTERAERTERTERTELAELAESGEVAESGQPRWPRDPSESTEPGEPSALAVRAPRFRLLGPRRPRATDGAAASTHAAATVPLARRLYPADQTPRVRGTVIHALLEQVMWLEDFSASDADLLAVARRAAPRADAALLARCIADFRAVLERPGIAAELRAGDRDRTSMEAQNERPWIRMYEEGVQRGFIDRVEIDRSVDPPVVTVVDWKTDPVAEEGGGDCRAIARADASAATNRPGQLGLFETADGSRPGEAGGTRDVPLAGEARGTAERSGTADPARGSDSGSEPVHGAASGQATSGPPTLAHHVERYALQVEAYRAVMVAAEPEADVRIRLAFTEPGLVVELDAAGGFRRL
ncbi:MAG: UvrD-helicase domain-containing protein [Phycisphaerales bacterium]